MSDYISRADAMAEFRECVKRANENGETPTWNDAVSLIGSLPSADAEQTEAQKGSESIKSVLEEQCRNATTKQLHGRLIDGDELKNTIEKMQENMEVNSFGRLEPNANDILYVLEDMLNRFSFGRPHGEWVCKEREYNDCDGHYAHYWYECSVCGARPPKDTWKNEWHSNYCPSCGARMKGGDDE